MSDLILQEIWQVEVGGQLFEAPFAELGVWVGEGALLPDDKVRKGNLRWIEARKVPYLVPFFNAREKGFPMPIVASTTDASVGSSSDEHENIVHEPAATGPQVGTDPIVPPSTAPKPAPGFCAIHPGLEAVFVCNGCRGEFCRPCPKAFGGTVRICPICGSMCRPVAEAKKAEREAVGHADLIAEGFGIQDLVRALSHPLRFKPSLFFGALMFMAFSLGQSVSALGGIFMMASALLCLMLANMLTFGVLSHTVENFSKGHLDADFMPGFEDFSIWDDVVRPFFLSIAAYAASFGPFFITMLVGLYLVMSTVSSQINSVQSDLERIPGTHYYAAQDTAEQSERVKQVIGNLDRLQRERIAAHEELAAGNTNVQMVDGATLEQERLWAETQQMRKAQLESAIGNTPETRGQKEQAMIQGFLNLPAPLVVTALIFFLWGAFYFPAACAVAGYTRSFAATISFAVGMDTIKRLGASYVKILLMTAALVAIWLVVGGIAALILSPFDLPGLGNLPAKALVALFVFYLSVVFSCVLGYALFKASDRLSLPR